MFRVRWSKVAEQSLANDWLQADSALRKAITSAAYQIDLILAQDPNNAGESRPNGRRILMVPPLGVLYRVEADGKTVSVLRAWVFKKRK